VSESKNEKPIKILNFCQFFFRL